MARSFTTGALALLQSGNLMARWLMTIYLDAGTYYFCDDWADMSDGTHTYIGASALAGGATIQSSQPFAAESVTLTIDGTRLSEVGISDPASLFQTILSNNLAQRRVDLALGLAAIGSTTFSLVIPTYAGKINSARVEESQVDILSMEAGGTSTPCKLMIVLDSLAMRYQVTLGRTRSHHDQLEIDSSDNFFKFVNDTISNEHTLYWGKANPPGTVSGGFFGIQSYTASNIPKYNIGQN